MTFNPTPEEVHEALSEWCWSRRAWRRELVDVGSADIDDWLARVKREAAAEALIEVAEQMVPAFELDAEDELFERRDATWNSTINIAAGELRARAAEYRNPAATESLISAHHKRIRGEEARS